MTHRSDNLEIVRRAEGEKNMVLLYMCHGQNMVCFAIKGDSRYKEFYYGTDDLKPYTISLTMVYMIFVRGFTFRCYHFHCLLAHPLEILC